MRCLLNSLIPVFLVLSIGAAAADNNNGGGNDSGGDGGRSPEESWIANDIRLRLAASNGERILRVFLAKMPAVAAQKATEIDQQANTAPKQVLIEIRSVEVTDVNKLDLSGIPLFGGLVGPEFNADDMTEENRVGNVYSTGDGGLFVVLQPTALGDPGQLNLSRLVVFNDDYSHEVKPLQLEVLPIVSPDSRYVTLRLGPTLADLPSVQSVTQVQTNVAVPGGSTILLGGLKQEEVRNDENQVPFLSDVPVLNQMFRGTAHQDGRSNLLILIKPSVVIQED